MFPDQKTNILLTISNEIARVRDKDDLLRVIGTSLQQYLPFEDSFIMRYHSASNSCRPYIFHIAEEHQPHPAFEKFITVEYPVHDTAIGNDNPPIVYKVEELLPHGGEALSLIHEAGITSLAVVKLVEQNAFTGLLVLLSQKADVFLQEHLGLLQHIAYPLASATGAVISSEDMAKREVEQAKLLLLSNEIATVQDRKGLTDLLNKRLAELFAIDGFGITLLNENKKTHSPFIVDAEREIAEHSEYKKVVNLRYNVNDGVFNNIIEAEAPVTLYVQALAALKEAPEYVLFWEKLGIKKVVGIPVRVGETKLGCFIMLYSRQTNEDFNINLITSICAQLSVAISHILAIEENARREEEKSILLSLSYEIAALRSRADLFHIVNARLKRLFSLKEFGIAQINEGRQTYGAFILDHYDNLKELPGYYEITSARYQVGDAVFSRVLASDLPVVLRVQELLSEPTAPAYVQFWHQAGFAEVICVALRAGGNDVGCVFLHPEKETAVAINTNLITGVCAQLSVAVSNILTNEELVRREKEKSSLLAFTNAIASVRDKKAMSAVVKEQLDNLFGIEDFAIYVLGDDMKTLSPVLYDPSAYFVKHLEYLQLVDEAFVANDDILLALEEAGQPVSFTVYEWFCAGSKVAVKTLEAFRFQTMTGCKIHAANGTHAILTFSYNERSEIILQSPLFKSVCSQLSITIYNILANEKISNQLAEISRYKQQLEQEKLYLKEEIATNQNYSDIIGEGSEMKKVFKMVGQVASSSSTVLLLGETGTGKELIARALHNASPRKNKLMIKVNCAALPANLIESELFGHERGSFTGATERRLGKFELANHGTLFLDEIGEMPLELQVKLLRAIQEREIERVGGTTTIKVDVRIIAATNRDLEKMMEEGKFRTDLFYRLNIFPIPLPPLRQRREDIPALAAYFLTRYARKAGRPPMRFAPKVVDELVQYNWPGNIRELEHLIERSVLLARDEVISEVHLSPVKNKPELANSQSNVKIKTIDENEKEHILAILKHCRGKITGPSGAAELLGVPPSTLNSKIKKLGIKKEFFS
ncbi:MAG TPA: sigma 54-interacting transcriptional regulator [Chitinophagaceae bacterium]|nr:sigma 54-interacting transcriptional regulator [Chitinophagaceae bacterium]